MSSLSRNTTPVLTSNLGFHLKETAIAYTAPVRIGVVGLWHLGFVYAACLAELGHSVIAYDPDQVLIRNTRSGQYPVEEFGLPELIRKQVADNNLHFTDSLDELRGASVIWVTHDVEVDSHDFANLRPLDNLLSTVIDISNPEQVLVVSSQVPVGYCRNKQLEAAAEGKFLSVGYSPENLRLGQSLDSFRSQDNWAIGSDSERVVEVFRSIFENRDIEIFDCGIETAEMMKHGLNSYLALNVTFGNELGRVCNEVGADAITVAMFMRKDPRVGNRAYILPGGPISGGTLMRDVQYLSSKSPIQGFGLPVLQSIWQSNRAQQDLIIQSIVKGCRSSSDPVVIMGLAYKEGSSAVRQSIALLLVTELINHGKEFVLFDPLVSQFDIGDISLQVTQSISTALCSGRDVVLLNSPGESETFLTELTRRTRTVFNMCNYPGFMGEPIAGVRLIGVRDL